jgi:hypothetical protein
MEHTTLEWRVSRTLDEPSPVVEVVSNLRLSSLLLCTVENVSVCVCVCVCECVCVCTRKRERVV